MGKEKDEVLEFDASETGSMFNSLTDALEKIKTIADVDSIVGQAVETKDGTVIIPISKMSVGFAFGGVNGKNSNPMSGSLGGGGGVSLDPVAFLVASKDDVRLLYMQSKDNATVNLTTALPNIVEMILDKFPTKKSKSDIAEEILKELEEE